MNLIYGVKDRPKPAQIALFALQQLLAILAATITVPMVVGNGMSNSAALFGAGVGTIVYLLFTKFRSPVFLGSSFAFLNSMIAAFAGAASMSLGYLGLLLGALFAGLVYVVLAVVVKFVGTGWIDKVMPAVVIGPTVAIIGLSLSGSAINWVVEYAPADEVTGAFVMSTHSGLCIICALVALAVTIVCSVYGKKTIKMIPFVLGILAGYAVASIFTAFSYIDGAEEMRIIDFSIFKQLSEGSSWYPHFAFLEAFKGNYGGNVGKYIGTIAVAYIPVAFVVFAEHLADHKNISSIIESDLLKDPGLHRTLLGDGVGSIAGAFFGGCPNTTYGESIGCVAISGNASVITTFVTACMAILIAFVAPVTLFLSSIPKCVMGGVCIALYGFIAVSGLKMIQKTDLNENRNLFVVSVILVAGVGGFALQFGQGTEGVALTNIACALILGILTNLLVNIHGKKEAEPKTLEDHVEVEKATEEEVKEAKPVEVVQEENKEEKEHE